MTGKPYEKVDLRRVIDDLDKLIVNSWDKILDGFEFENEDHNPTMDDLLNISGFLAVALMVSFSQYTPVQLDVPFVRGFLKKTYNGWSVGAHIPVPIYTPSKPFRFEVGVWGDKPVFAHIEIRDTRARATTYHLSDGTELAPEVTPEDEFDHDFFTPGIVEKAFDYDIETLNDCRVFNIEMAVFYARQCLAVGPEDGRAKSIGLSAEYLFANRLRPISTIRDYRRGLEKAIPGWLNHMQAFKGVPEDQQIKYHDLPISWSAALVGKWMEDHLNTVDALTRRMPLVYGEDWL